METDLIKRTTIIEMVTTWERAQKDITECLKTLTETEKRLEQVFGSYCWDNDAVKRMDTEKLLKSIRRRAWGYLIEKSEMRRLLSVRRAKELDEQLEKGELPEINEEEIIKMVKSAVENVGKFSDELIEEVFNILRPHQSGYKTDAKFASALGNRVILPHRVTSFYSGNGKFRCQYHYENDLRAIDNVFHALDGQGFSKSYYGNLYDAIEK